MIISVSSGGQEIVAEVVPGSVSEEEAVAPGVVEVSISLVVELDGKTQLQVSDSVVLVGNTKVSVSEELDTLSLSVGDVSEDQYSVEDGRTGVIVVQIMVDAEYSLVEELDSVSLTASVDDVSKAVDDSVASGVDDVPVSSEKVCVSLDVRLAEDSVGIGPVVDSFTTSLDVDPVSDSLALELVSLSGVEIVNDQETETVLPGVLEVVELC